MIDVNTRRSLAIKFVASCVDDYGQDDNDRMQGYAALFQLAEMKAFVQCSEQNEVDVDSIVFNGDSRALVDTVMKDMPDTMKNQQRIQHVIDRVTAFIAAKKISLDVLPSVGKVS